MTIAKYALACLSLLGLSGPCIINASQQYLCTRQYYIQDDRDEQWHYLRGLPGHFDGGEYIEDPPYDDNYRNNAQREVIA